MRIFFYKFTKENIYFTINLDRYNIEKQDTTFNTSENAFKTFTTFLMGIIFAKLINHLNLNSL